MPRRPVRASSTAPRLPDISASGEIGRQRRERVADASAISPAGEMSGRTEVGRERRPICLPALGFRSRARRPAQRGNRAEDRQRRRRTRRPSAKPPSGVAASCIARHGDPPRQRRRRAPPSAGRRPRPRPCRARRRRRPPPRPSDRAGASPAAAMPLADRLGERARDRRSPPGRARRAAPVSTGTPGPRRRCRAHRRRAASSRAESRRQPADLQTAARGDLDDAVAVPCAPLRRARSSCSGASPPERRIEPHQQPVAGLHRRGERRAGAAARAARSCRHLLRARLGDQRGEIVVDGIAQRMPQAAPARRGEPLGDGARGGRVLAQQEGAHLRRRRDRRRAPPRSARRERRRWSRRSRPAGRPSRRIRRRRAGRAASGPR